MGNTLPPKKRELIARFDPEVEEITVAEFCRRNDVATSSFYRIKDRAREEGLGAALTPRSRAPKQPARRYGPFTVAAVRQAHAELVKESKEAGPWSVEWRLFQEGLDPLPSRSTIARIMRREGLSQPSPRKRPRASFRRFRRASGNELWQLDGFEWELDDATPVTIYQLIDDHSRLCPALLALEGGETHQGARAVLEAGFAGFGKPEAVLSDNSRAFNQHRLGRLSATEAWLAGQGIRPISGRIHHPQTQGKNERSHQPAQHWLEGKPAATLAELQTTLDRFRHWYNHERQHQGLGHHLTPITVWEGSAKKTALPAPIPPDLLYRQPLRQPPHPNRERRIGTFTIAANQKITWKAHTIGFAWDMTGRTVHLVEDEHQLEIYDDNGELHAVSPWPPPHHHISATQPPVRLTTPTDRRRRPRNDDTDPSQKT